MVASARGMTRTDQEANEMLYFRACPKCRTGTIEHNRDPYTEYLQCLNCGLMRDLPDNTDAVTWLKQLKIEFEAAAIAEAAEEAGVGASSAA